MGELDHLNKDEFLAHIAPIREDIRELVTLQREQNGRVTRAETKIAILEDRNPGRVAGTVSAVVSGVISGLAVWLSGHRP